MFDKRREDILHKSYLNRVLMEIIDDPIMAHHLAFKGGTCASMVGYLDRFSVDLDFDVMKDADEVELHNSNKLGSYEE
jgi:predicted nucleotidyltransferase component of viral defense system